MQFSIEAILKQILMVGFALLMFAANSVLCRLALYDTTIDPVTFTLVRLLSGSLCLIVLVILLRNVPLENHSRFASASFFNQKSVFSACFLLGYAVFFSLAYVEIDAGIGALILFASVQITMLSVAWMRNDKFNAMQWCGFAIAFMGLVYLLDPFALAHASVDLHSSLLMLVAGVSWGAYTLLGKGVVDPLTSTMVNFILTLPLMAIIAILSIATLEIDTLGLIYAIASGALASAIGYAVWYAVLPMLKSSTAASLQLSVPVIAGLGGVLLIDEVITSALILSAVMILSGITIILRKANQ